MRYASNPFPPRDRRVALWLALAPLAAATACEDPQPPAPCGPMPAITIHAGETAMATACFNDPNGDALTYAVTSSRPGVATATVAGQTVTVSGVAPGDAVVTVTATDPGGMRAEQGFPVSVPNRAPQPNGSIPDQTVAAGQVVAVNVAAYFSEPDGETLTYTAATSNSAAINLNVVGSDVRITGVARGAADITVTATDPGGLAATQAFRATVPNRAPVAVGTVPPHSIEEGQDATIDASAYFDDPDGDALTYSATSSRPSVASVSVAGSAVTIEATSVGTAAIAITAADPDGLTAVQSFAITVTPPPNRPPEPVGTIPPQLVFESESETVNLVSYFTDPDGDDLVYAGSSSDADVASVDIQGSVLTITGGDLGDANVTVTATDPDGLSAIQRVAVTVIVWSEDRSILTEFYDAADGPDWDNSDNWLTGEALGNWYGVTANDSGRVTHLELIDNDVATLTAGLGGLEELVRLDLSENFGMDSRIPRQLGNLSKLEWLDISGSLFFGRGSIPPELGNLTNLKRLDLSESRFWPSSDLTIPTEFGNLASLERLDLRQIRIKGRIPSSLGGLANLTWLDLSHNLLEGEIPRSFMDLSLIRFHWDFNFGLCAPADEEFQEWLATIEDHNGPTCAESGSG